MMKKNGSDRKMKGVHEGGKVVKITDLLDENGESTPFMSILMNGVEMEDLEDERSRDDEKNEVKNMLADKIDEKEWMNYDDDGDVGMNKEKVSIEDLLKNSIYSERKDLLEKLKVNGRYRVDFGVDERMNRELERGEQYFEVKDDLNQWNDVVNRMRERECLKFPLRDQVDRRGFIPRTKSIVSKFEPKYELEKTVEYILKKSGQIENSLNRVEDERVESMSKEELREYCRRMSRLRALTFYQNRENRRIRKIKSKKWHRIHRRSMKKNSLTLEELRELDMESYKEVMERMDRERIKERMRIKHKNMNTWARHALRSKNPNLKSAVEEHLKLGKELMRKIDRRDSDSDSDSDLDSDFENDIGVDKMELGDGDIVDINGQVVENLKGEDEISNVGMVQDNISRLPFMKKAAMRLQKTTRMLDDQMENENLIYQKKLAAKNAIENDDDDGEDIHGFLDEIEKNIIDAKTVEDDHKDESQGRIKFGATEKQRIHRDILQFEREDYQMNDSIGNGTFCSETDGKLTVKNIDTTVNETKSKFDKSESIRVSENNPFMKTTRSSSQLHIECNEKKILLEEKNYGGNGESKVFDMENVGQRQLVRRAFASDCVMEEELLEEKRAILSKELSEVESKYAGLIMPGWGEWAGSGTSVSKRRRNNIMKMEKEKKEKLEELMARRIDANINNVIVNEMNVPFSKYQLDVTPTEYEGNPRVYDALLRHPIGKEWNTHMIHSKLTRPSITVQPGVSIQPLVSKTFI